MNDDAIDPPPSRPLEPDAGDCCGEGCARCVFDVHEEALEHYRRALAAWQARHPPSNEDHHVDRDHP
ncbi:MAG: oxidoreductase-like domain-containing protein [Rhodanobacter sp.]